jgi:hypothetical protein
MHWKIARDLEKMEKPIFAESELEPTPRGEDTIRTLKHVKDRAANLAERPQRVSSVARITSTLRAGANARTFLRSARSCFALHNQGHHPASGDLAHLSPLGWEHIKSNRRLLLVAT